MHFYSAGIALAIIGFTSALPANTYSSTSTDCSTPSPTPSVSCTSSPTSTGCSTPPPTPSVSCTASPTPQPCKPSCPPLPNCNTSCSTQPPNTTCGETTGSNIIKPKVTSQYEVSTGAVRHGTSNGKIFKDGKTTDITTLLTFDFPTASAGKTCSFHFDLCSDPAAKVSGTGQFDVFISLAPATRTTTTWPSGNLRDQHIGRMRAQPNAAATWVAGLPTFGQSFPCPAGKTYGGELVGTGDVDHIEWLASTSGAYIKWQ